MEHESDGDTYCNWCVLHHHKEKMHSEIELIIY